ncbi:MAG TPA: RagB/SusD family nutrient uptake outer membrane protein [Bacteroidaceae bacterium]|nr:RagB/SusD family nutrient uptake outer membrane protein [Bacteroidaceae bacterium]
MIHKNIKKIFSVVILSTALSSCNFLDIDNPTYVTDEFYNTYDGQKALITDIYSRFRGLYNTGELQYYGTDIYMAITESPNEKMFNGYDKTFNSTAGVVGPYWQNLYKIVQESNTLINRCSPEETGKDYDRFIANGLFFRSLAYYYLVETFGPVPFYTEEQTEVITSATRESEEKIYSTIIQDLESIKDILPMKAEKKGEISKAAVLQLLGKCYLTRAYKSYSLATDFSDAAECFEEIINDPNKTYYMLPKFSDVFDENNQGNSEIIWAIQYGEDKMYAGSGNPQQALFGFNITAVLPQWYDKIQEDYSFMQRGYWVNPAVHEWFVDPIIDSRYDATFVREFYVNNSSSEDNGKLGLYFPRWNETDDQGALKCIQFYNEDGGYNWYPQSTALAVLEQGSDFMPMIRKFKDTKMTWGGPGTREDIVMRVADTYLLCAEAYLGAGSNDMALKYINDVRKRAATSESYEEDMTISTVDIDIILDERARELLGEHDRWFDLKRTGKLIERAKKYNIFVQKYDNINQNHLLRPIPYDETSKVDGLEQNEGYM